MTLAILEPGLSELCPDPYQLPLEQIDVSQPQLYQYNLWPEYFRRLRNEDPVHFCADSAHGPYWSVTRFEEILEVERNPEIFSSEPLVVIGDMEDELKMEAFIMMDEPRHSEHRMAVQPVVAPANLRELEGVIRKRAQDILDELPIGETFNWVERVSIELTTQMLATLFAFPFEERNKLTYWSDMAVGSDNMTGGSIPQEERLEGMADCLRTFTELWHQRAQEGSKGFDLISLLQRDPNTRDMVNNPMEFMGTLALLIIGGNDTTRNSISGGVAALNEFPAEFDKLCNNPQLIPSMVSEIIRWQTPLGHMRRRATRDTELGGKTIREGEKVVMWFLSGNRDERAIERPDEFIIDRKNARHHLSFGFGIHRCMGNRLGEMQLRILWEEILARFDDIKVMAPPQRIQSNLVMGYDELWVQLTPRTGA